MPFGCQRSQPVFVCERISRRKSGIRGVLQHLDDLATMVAV